MNVKTDNNPLLPAHKEIHLCPDSYMLALNLQGTPDGWYPAHRIKSAATIDDTYKVATQGR